MSSRWKRCRGSMYSQSIRMPRASRLLRNFAFMDAFGARSGIPVSSPVISSGIEFLQIREGELDERADRLLAEIELELRRGEELGERLRPAQRFRMPIRGDRTLSVLLGVLPHLERARLRDPVLDVVKGHRVNVKLSVPAPGLRILKARPVLRAAQTATEIDPPGATLVARVVGMRVRPVLERVDRRDPRVRVQQILEMVRAGAVGVGL